MKLISQTPHGSSTLIELDEDGSVRGPRALSGKPLGTFDDRGCIVAADGLVVADHTTGTDLWMRRAPLEGSGRRVGHFTIDKEGKLTAEGLPDIVMVLEGFEERGLCAGKLMVVSYLAMMSGVSMAVVEGVAEELPPPKDSACPDRHEPH
jgi:hypothetical protein